jgi:hypothetical protein
VRHSGAGTAQPAPSCRFGHASSDGCKDDQADRGDDREEDEPERVAAQEALDDRHQERWEEPAESAGGADDSGERPTSLGNQWGTSLNTAPVPSPSAIARQACDVSCTMCL